MGCLIKTLYINSNIILELWKGSREDNGLLVEAAEQISEAAEDHAIHGLSYWGATSASIHKNRTKYMIKQKLFFLHHTTLPLSIPPYLRKKKTGTQESR